MHEELEKLKKEVIELKQEIRDLREQYEYEVKMNSFRLHSIMVAVEKINNQIEDATFLPNIGMTRGESKKEIERIVARGKERKNEEYKESTCRIQL